MSGILFRTEASPCHGFGHLARCLRLASHVRDSRPNIAVTIQGEFDQRSISAIATDAPWARIAAPDEVVAARLAVIDRLADPEDTESWDHALAATLVERCEQVVAVLSGRTDPVHHPHVWRIGYQPGGPAEAPPLRRWGLRFAPGLAAPLHPPSIRSASAECLNLLVAFGGGATARSFELLLETLPHIGAIRSADILVSPIAVDRGGPTVTAAGQTLRWHRGSDDVRGLIERADAVLASFGNFAYEALSLGRPVCYLNQKRFQTELAMEMERIGLAVSAGDAAHATPNVLAAALRRTFKDRERAMQTATVLDGRGIERIANIVCKAIDPLDTTQCARSA